MPLGWFSRKSWAIPAAKPPMAPEDGPSSMASTTVTRYMSSGFAPASFTWAKTVDWSRRPVRITAVHAMARRTPRVYRPGPPDLGRTLLAFAGDGGPDHGRQRRTPGR